MAEARYTIEKSPLGWSVIDSTTGVPMKVAGKFMEGLALEDADDLADALTALEVQKGRSMEH
jgi:hypothetical protein